LKRTWQVVENNKLELPAEVQYYDMYGAVRWQRKDYCKKCGFEKKTTGTIDGITAFQ
jgi:hypothetical protein